MKEFCKHVLYSFHITVIHVYFDCIPQVYMKSMSITDSIMTTLFNIPLSSESWVA